MISSIGDLTKAAGGKITLNSVLPIEMMMILGVYRFCIANAAYQNFKRATEYDWREQKRLGMEPASQYVGAGADTIDLDGAIYPQFRGGLRQVSLMRAEAGFGKPLFLISGNGNAFGRWYIVSIIENQTCFLKDGTPRKIEFSLSLKRYGEEAAHGMAGIVQQALKAL